MSLNDWWNKNFFSSCRRKEETDGADCTSSGSVPENEGCDKEWATAGCWQTALRDVQLQRERRPRWSVYKYSAVHTCTFDRQRHTSLAVDISWIVYKLKIQLSSLLRANNKAIVSGSRSRSMSSPGSHATSQVASVVHRRWSADSCTHAYFTHGKYNTMESYRSTYVYEIATGTGFFRVYATLNWRLGNGARSPVLPTCIC